ncbi:hypothetical protein PILCRDRAFT_812910 [Piloderma croceum F 1598]|uniref:Nephrocystin 3-like N-terminal domain-containing protein n=1 Tax=Piloderma croceum (strain F 1598) TaxID=765440 RepID=A0A0C3GBD1_PILCF|nr:hypothetical protein PILCRDRAFT_812910 [Piloderma croceum F 1598]
MGRRWLLESQVFQAWLEGISETLWCLGMPGAGKTILASIVVDHLRNLFRDKNVAVACIYCNYKEKNNKMVRELIATVLKQDNTVLSDNVKLLYDCDFVRGTRPELNNLTEILRLEIGTYSRVFIVVDALDELSEHDQLFDH